MVCCHRMTRLQACLDVTLIFADGKNIQLMNHILLRPTLLIAATVNTQRSVWWETETMEVESGSHWGQTSLFQHILLQQKHLLLLLSYLWHYNRYFTFTHGNSTHPTLNPYGKHLTSENSSHHEHLHYGKMAAVSIRHNAYRKLCPVNSIALITFSILYT